VLQQIPTFSDVPNYSIQASLDDVTYSLRFQWSPRDGYWYLYVYDITETQLLVGAQRIVIGFPLAAGSAPWPGRLFATLPTPLALQQSDLEQIALLYRAAA